MRSRILAALGAALACLVASCGASPALAAGLSIYEFTTPYAAHPATQVTRNVAYGTSFQLQPSTRYVEIVTDAGARIRTSYAGAAADGTDVCAQAYLTFGRVLGIDASGANRPVIVTSLADSSCTNAGGPQPSASANYGVAPVTTTTGTLVAKSAPANLYGLHFTEGATGGYFALLNAAAAPSAGAAIAPLECLPVAANTEFRARQDIPDRYSVGLVIVHSTNCTTFTAPTNTPQLMAALVQ